MEATESHKHTGLPSKQRPSFHFFPSSKSNWIPLKRQLINHFFLSWFLQAQADRSVWNECFWIDMNTHELYENEQHIKCGTRRRVCGVWSSIVSIDLVRCKSAHSIRRDFTLWKRSNLGVSLSLWKVLISDSALHLFGHGRWLEFKLHLILMVTHWGDRSDCQRFRCGFMARVHWSAVSILMMACDKHLFYPLVHPDEMLEDWNERVQRAICKLQWDFLNACTRKMHQTVMEFLNGLLFVFAPRRWVFVFHVRLHQRASMKADIWLHRVDRFIWFVWFQHCAYAISLALRVSFANIFWFVLFCVLVPLAPDDGSDLHVVNCKWIAERTTNTHTPKMWNIGLIINLLLWMHTASPSRWLRWSCAVVSEFAPVQFI